MLKRLAAALLLPPFSLGVGCVFPRPKRSLPRDYPSFCSEPLELLTQLLRTEKLCICIDCVFLSPSLSPIPSTVQRMLLYIVNQFAFDTATPLQFHSLLFTFTREEVTLHLTL